MNTLRISIYSMLWLLCSSIEGKVLIFTHAFNRADFVEIQYKTFKKFLHDEYEYVVFNDATNKDFFKAIEDMCKKYHIKHIPIPQDIHKAPHHPVRLDKASIRNCRVVQWSLEVLGFAHDDILAIVDSDLFLVKEFSMREFLKDHQIGAWMKSCKGTHASACSVVHPGVATISYLWIGLVLMDLKTLPKIKKLNFDCGYINNVMVDSGGYSHYYLKEFNPKVHEMHIEALPNLFCAGCKARKATYCDHNTAQLKKRNFSEELIWCIQHLPRTSIRNTEFFLDGTFIHYRCGSNYQPGIIPKQLIEQKNKVLGEFIEKIV